MGVVLARVTTDPIDLATHLAAVEGPDAGAVASFCGTIRDHDPEAAGVVTGIDYTCHPDADRLIGVLAAAVAAEVDPDGVTRIAVSHRVGRLEVGEIALIACVASAHRGPAFAVCQAVVERIKGELPIWKQQFEADGRAVWSGLGL